MTHDEKQMLTFLKLEVDRQMASLDPHEGSENRQRYTVYTLAWSMLYAHQAAVSNDSSFLRGSSLSSISMSLKSASSSDDRTRGAYSVPPIDRLFGEAFSKTSKAYV